MRRVDVIVDDTNLSTGVRGVDGREKTLSPMPDDRLTLKCTGRRGQSGATQG
jgi:hypothetical protein